MGASRSNFPDGLRDIFLSHRSTSKEFTRRLAGDIESQTYEGRSLLTWLDEAEIRHSQSLPGSINYGLEHSRFFGIVMTPEYFHSETGWTDAEWHAALYMDPDNRRGRIITLLAADCSYIPILLRHLRMIDLRDCRYEAGLRELLAALKEEPLPRPVKFRGQLITTSGRIDRATLVAERTIPESDPDVVSERIYCNLLPIEKAPQRLYAAPIAKCLRRLRRDGSAALPSKEELKEAIRAAQSEAKIEKPFMPTFRVVNERIATFHDLTSPEGPLAPIIEDEDIEELSVAQLLLDADDRNLVVSLLNMAVSRYATRVGLIHDETRWGRFFFPSRNGASNVIGWLPRRTKASRTVAKPCLRDGRVLFWRNLGAYLKILFLASHFYLHIRPTWVITEDGQRVRTGPSVGRLIIKWTGPERNLHLLYHVRFWTSFLGPRPGPISIRAGDQWIEIPKAPAFVQQAYGIAHDQRDLLGLLDQEATLISAWEDVAADEAAAIEIEKVEDLSEDADDELDETGEDGAVVNDID